MNEERCGNCGYWQKWDEVLNPDDPPICINLDSDNFGEHTDKMDGCEEWDG